jgi:hypothetical protein
MNLDVLQATKGAYTAIDQFTREAYQDLVPRTARWPRLLAENPFGERASANRLCGSSFQEIGLSGSS